MPVSEKPEELKAEGPWAKLRRRKVVQWGIAYAAGGWGFLQVLEYAAETFHWPDPIRQLVTLALVFGIPVIVVIAWFHGDRGAQRVSRLEMVLLTVLVAMGGGSLWWYSERFTSSDWRGEPAGPVRHAIPGDGPAVAVLPFVNMSSDPEQEYFSDGLSEQILNALAQVPGLYVPARTSSFRFKGQTGDVGEFAALLGVSTVLEGSVRKVGKRVRVTAQLINAADGFHLWSETYDRELQDIFAIQDDIAAKITDVLEIKLTAEQKLAAVQAAPTANIEAYEAYLLGRQELNARSPESVARSVGYFEKAVALDPQFAAALADLALALELDLEYSGRWPQPEILARAQALVQQALALSPQSAEVLAVAGFFEWDRDQSLAMDYFNRSLAVNPSNGEVLVWRMKMLWGSGHEEQASESCDEAARRDPLSGLALYWSANCVLFLGKTNEASLLAERLAALDRATGDLVKAVIASYLGNRAASVRSYLAFGDQRVAQGVDIESALSQGDVIRDFTLQLASLGLREEVFRSFTERPVRAHLLMGEYREALPLLRMTNGQRSPFDDWRLAETFYYLGMFAEAAPLYAEIYPQPSTVTFRATDDFLLVHAADAARRLGAEQVAAAYRDADDRVLTSLANAGVAIQGDLAYRWALLNAYDGRQDEAARNLIIAIAVSDYWRQAASEPLLAEVFRRADVEAALRAQDLVLDRQRSEVLKMLCGPDPASPNFRPAPGTCERLQSGRTAPDPGR